LIFCFLSTISLFAQQNLDQYVNPMIGTGGNGHTFPGATAPFGLVQLSPDTDVNGWDLCSGYHYSNPTIMGFSYTHLSGTGVADYGDILFMPMTDKLRVVPGDEKNPDNGYRSRFDHKTEVAQPGYYSVYLKDYKTKVELTATTRVGLQKYTFPKTKKAFVLIDLVHGIQNVTLDSEIKIIGNNTVAGYRKSSGAAKYTVYFYAKFARPFDDFGTVVDNKILEKKRYAKGKNVKGFFKFDASNNNEVLVKVGISFVNLKGAEENLKAEVPGWDFNKVREATAAKWNKTLNKIQVEGGTKNQKTVFYTALYHSLICPNTFNDVNGNYMGMDGKVHNSKNQDVFTVFSLWDTFRATHPLFTIIEPKIDNEMVETLLRKYKASGLLPVWELAGNETNIMIANHAIPVIVDAYMKGLRNYDIETAYKAIKHSTETDLRGLKYYKKFGFVPSDYESESVSKTLEFAYDDWCVAQMAKSLGKQKDYEYYIGRAKNYINLFDTSTGFMTARDNGNWARNFDPIAINSDYTEANAWQYTFFVPQDVDGLIKLYGGRKNFVSKLDELFNTSSKLGGSFQADVTGMIGQYAQGNEPDQQTPYLYNYAGAPWKTQHIVREIVDSLYKNTVDGLCGNDDCGQMSSWLVFADLGFYPVCPGSNDYIIGTPLFKKVTINLENGKKFVINAKNNSNKNYYIQSATFNGTDYNKSFISHSDLTNGGELTFQMGSEPNKSWCSSESSSPISKINYNKLPAPVIVSRASFFNDSLQIRMNDSFGNGKIYYTTNGNTPTENSQFYKEPITLHKTTDINALAFANGINHSNLVEAKFYKYNNEYSVKLYTQYSPRYTGGGPNALINQIEGGTDYRMKAWQGYEGNDLDAVINLGSDKTIDGLFGNFLSTQSVWIFFPKEVQFSISQDGKNWKQIIDIKNEVKPINNAEVKQIGKKFEPVKARYIKVVAKNIGKCPSWHPGAGGKAWIFVDEVKINVVKKYD